MNIFSNKTKDANNAVVSSSTMSVNTASTAPTSSTGIPGNSPHSIYTPVVSQGKASSASNFTIAGSATSAVSNGSNSEVLSISPPKQQHWDLKESIQRFSKDLGDTVTRSVKGLNDGLSKGFSETSLKIQNYSMMFKTKAYPIALQLAPKITISTSSKGNVGSSTSSSLSSSSAMPSDSVNANNCNHGVMQNKMPSVIKEDVTEEDLKQLCGQQEQPLKSNVSGSRASLSSNTSTCTYGTVDGSAVIDTGNNGNTAKMKKARRSGQIGRWTAEEDKLLVELVEQEGGRNWRKISSYFKDRTPIQCLNRWQKVLNPNLTKGSWTLEEDKLLVELVLRYGTDSWSQISKCIPGRLGKQCRERWLNHLDPGVHKEPFSEREVEIVKEGHESLGNKWAEIVQLLAKNGFPGRTDNQVKNLYHSLEYHKARGTSRRKRTTLNINPCSNITSSQSFGINPNNKYNNNNKNNNNNNNNNSNIEDSGSNSAPIIVDDSNENSGKNCNMMFLESFHADNAAIYNFERDFLISPDVSKTTYNWKDNEKRYLVMGMQQQHSSFKENQDFLENHHRQLRPLNYLASFDASGNSGHNLRHHMSFNGYDANYTMNNDRNDSSGNNDFQNSNRFVYERFPPSASFGIHGNVECFTDPLEYSTNNSDPTMTDCMTDDDTAFFRESMDLSDFVVEPRQLVNIDGRPSVPPVNSHVLLDDERELDDFSPFQ